MSCPSRLLILRWPTTPAQLATLALIPYDIKLLTRADGDVGPLRNSLATLAVQAKSTAALHPRTRSTVQRLTELVTMLDSALCDLLSSRRSTMANYEALQTFGRDHGLVPLSTEMCEAVLRAYERATDSVSSVQA